jgi:hypothetical protein
LYGEGIKVSLEKYIKIVERVAPGGPDDRGFGNPTSGDSQQDLGDGFVATTVDVGGFTVKAVLDTTTNTYLTPNNRPEGGGAIIRNMAPFIMIRNGKIDMVMSVGPKTQEAMKKAGILQGGVQETYESSEQVRSIVQRMMEDARVPQKPRQGPLRPQTGAGKHKDKKRDQKQGKEKHKKPFMEQGVAEADYSPMTKDSMKADKIRSLKNLIAKYKEQGRQLKVQELELELKKLQGVAETSDYFRRREREEAIISGQKPARKKQPAQTSDYARRREQEKKAEKGVAEGSGKNVVKSVKVGNFRHDLVDTGFGWQVRIYNGDELYDTGLSKNSEQKGLAALDDAVAYTKKQLNIKEQGVAEGYTGRETKDGTWRVFKDGQAVAVAGPFKSRDEAHAWIKKHKQGVAEGSLETDNMVSHISQIIQSIYPRGGDKNTYMKLVAQEMPRIVKANPKLFRRAFGMAYDRFFHIDQDDDFDYTDYSMRQGERGMEEGVAEGSQPPVCKHCGKRQGEHQRGKCPKGTKTAVGYTDYGPTKFEPKEPKQQGVAEGRRDRDGGWDGTMGWEKRNPLRSRGEEPQPHAQTRDDDEPKMSLAALADKQMRDKEDKPKVKRDPPGTRTLPGGFKVHFEAIQRDLKLPDSYYLQLSSGAKSDLKNLYIDHILESVSGVKKDTLETVSYPELKNIVRMIEEKQKGVDGKACWKGYKRMGTKKKGRRTVDNCVKAESLQEKSPPGFKGTVKAMKKHPELTKGKTKDGKEKNPWALAWHMKNKGYKSHKKADGSDKD